MAPMTSYPVLPRSASSDLGGAILEVLIISSVVVLTLWATLEDEIKRFSGDQIEAQELVTAYSTFIGHPFEVSDMGPDGLLRLKQAADVDDELEDLARDLRDITGVNGFCAAALSADPNVPGVQVEAAVDEGGASCIPEVVAAQRAAFEESLDPLGGLQFGVTVRNVALYPEISAHYRTADRPNIIQ